jgi:hypothetical protein
VEGRGKHINCYHLASDEKSAPLPRFNFDGRKCNSHSVGRKNNGNGTDAASGPLGKVLKVPDNGNTLTLLGISLVTLAAFGHRS